MNTRGLNNPVAQGIILIGIITIGGQQKKANLLLDIVFSTPKADGTMIQLLIAYFIHTFTEQQPDLKTLTNHR